MIIGAVAGLLVIWALFFVERVLRIDDPVGAVAVHGINGLWGVVALGLMADGSYGQGWNGVHKLVKDGQLMTVVNDGTAAAHARFVAAKAAGWIDQGVTGAFGKLYGAAYNDWSQLGAQLVGGVTNMRRGRRCWRGLWFRVGERAGADAQQAPGRDRRPGHPGDRRGSVQRLPSDGRQFTGGGRADQRSLAFRTSLAVQRAYRNPAARAASKTR